MTGLKNEIERRTRDTAKLIEIETKKLAVGEMVLERLDAILDLLRAAGFKSLPVHKSSPLPQAAPPPNTVVVQASALAPEPSAPITRPCAVCGQEAAFDEPMPDGTKKYYCRPHGQARMREKAEEAETTKLMGSTGTMYARPMNPNAKPAQKLIIQAPAADPLKGPFPPNGPTVGPPPNSVLDE